MQLLNHFLLLLFCAIGSISLHAQINTPAGATTPFGMGTYDYGIIPTNLPSGGTYGASQDAADAYNEWKTNYVEDCGSGQCRVRYDDASVTVSEGIAYGMLLAAYAADKDLLDCLWAYYKNWSNGNGVMNWRINGCSSVAGNGGATDAELDAAMALIVANHQWPSTTTPHDYTVDATALITAIKDYEIQPTSANGPYQTNNGDQWGFGNDCRNPSYQSPAYYDCYGMFVPSQASFWADAYAASYTLINANAHPTTGLVSNWSNPSGTSNSCNGPDEYGWDACRNPWRMATAVAWTNEAQAKTLMNKVATYLNGIGASNANGPVAQSGGVGSYHSPAFVGTWGAGLVGADATHQTLLNQFYTETIATKDNLPFYFGNTLRVIGLFTMTQNFWKPGDVVVTGRPTAVIDASATSGEPGVIITFDGSNSSDPDADPLKYSWDFGDGTTSTDQMPPAHTYTTAGVYLVTLLVDDCNGNTHSTSVTITVAEPVAICEDFEAEFRVTEQNATENQIRAQFRVVNKTNQTIPLSEFTLRYWFTNDTGPSTHAADIDYANVGAGNITTNFNAVSPAHPQADYYMEVGFTAGAGNLAANGNSGEVQTRFHKSNWSNFDETNDYSYDPTKTSFTVWNQVTLYRNGILVCGVEPTIETRIQAKVFLQGSYNGTDMDTELGTLIPLEQPYSILGYNGAESVGSIPADVVDWVLLEIRDPNDSAVILARRACFVKKDGTLVELDGSVGVLFANLGLSTAYISVRHRNHLGMMTNDPVDLN